MSQPALVGTEQPLQGGDHPSLGDDQDRPGRIRGGNPLRRGHDPGRERVPGLAAGRGAQPAMAPRLERTWPARLDLGASETAPLPDVILTKAGLDQDAVREAQLASGHLGRDPGSLKIGCRNRGKTLWPQQSPCDASLVLSLR